MPSLAEKVRSFLLFSINSEYPEAPHVGVGYKEGLMYLQNEDDIRRLKKLTYPIEIFVRVKQTEREEK